MFQTRIVEKMKIKILCSINVRKLCRLLDKGEKYCRGGETTFDKIIRRAVEAG